MPAVAVSLLFLLGFGGAQSSAEDFGHLVAKVPSGANTIVILNMEKVRNSPLGIREGWKQNLEKAFADGLFRVPPQAARFVLASQLDLESLEPVWEAVVGEVTAPLAVEDFVLQRGGVLDALEGRPAAALANGAYVVQLGPKLLGGIGPGNRQVALRWMREISSKQNAPSAYLTKAASYSDQAGTEIILAADLAGGFAPKRIENYLTFHEELLKQNQVDHKALADLLASIQGVRLGVLIGEQPFGKLAVDFGQTVSFTPDFIKNMMVTILTDAGAMIDDINQWKPQVNGSEVSLSGTLTKGGLRRLMSLTGSPAPAAREKSAETTQAPHPSKVASATLAQFQAITDMFDDLKQDWKNLESLSKGAIYFDKYAKKIEQLPMLNVDPEMLDYRAFVAQQLRAASGSVRTMGIRGSYRQSQTTVGDVGYYGDGYGYGYYGSGGYYGGGYYSAREQTRDEISQKTAIRSQETATMATNVATLRNQVIAVTNDIRRKMTQKYQIEF
jgi:hypothetical protein